ncbi:hypothetical protein B0H10DRAFT_2434296 [Mycena sp. CBHHK59/15]|nr:hypothetical protein B0H10DRAFT_2434296 [Mycena sp. CBHHK59/15]
MQGTLPTTARLLALPPEVLDAIALHVATRPPNLGLPTGLPPLFRTCRALAACAGPALEARVWRAKFTPDDDDGEHAGRGGGGAIRRRAAQLRHACAALRVLRTGDVHAPGAGPALHVAYRLLLGDDAQQRNRGQLVWAGAEEFALRYVRDRLYDGRWAEGRKGWPRGGVDGEGSDAACALWVMWFMGSDGGCLFLFFLFFSPLLVRLWLVADLADLVDCPPPRHRLLPSYCCRARRVHR